MPVIVPPGHAQDLDEAGKLAWSEFLSDRIDEELRGPGVRQFFNPTVLVPGPDAAEKEIDWSAFPKKVAREHASDVGRWAYADRNRQSSQDEYCEWHVEKNSVGKVVRVTFTSEGPEYWGFLAKHSPSKLLELYRKLVSPGVTSQQLVDGDGNYNPLNKWNDPKRGGKIVHLSHESNTLFAFVNIGARATIIRRRPNGSVMTGETELIECGGYGDPNRHSDPHIGGEVNSLARLGARISFANPVGLSMDGLFPTGWQTPDGSNPLDYWKVVRGTKEHQLRAVYEVPALKGFVVGDIKINGRRIQYGGQIADFVRVKLVGLAFDFGRHKANPIGCGEEYDVAEADPAADPTAATDSPLPVGRA